MDGTGQDGVGGECGDPAASETTHTRPSALVVPSGQRSHAVAVPGKLPGAQASTHAVAAVSA